MTPSELVTERWREHALSGYGLEMQRAYQQRIKRYIDAWEQAIRLVTRLNDLPEVMWGEPSPSWPRH